MISRFNLHFLFIGFGGWLFWILGSVSFLIPPFAIFFFAYMHARGFAFSVRIQRDVAQQPVFLGRGKGGGHTAFASRLLVDRYIADI
jgi:hypothetical protein